MTIVCLQRPKCIMNVTVRLTDSRLTANNAMCYLRSVFSLTARGGERAKNLLGF